MKVKFDEHLVGMTSKHDFKSWEESLSVHGDMLIVVFAARRQ